MPLFNVLFDGQQTFVVAENYREAVELFKERCVSEAEGSDAEDFDPDGVTKVCDDSDLMLPDAIFTQDKSPMVTLSLVALCAVVLGSPGRRLVLKGQQLRSLPKGGHVDVLQITSKDPLLDGGLLCAWVGGEGDQDA